MAQVLIVDDHDSMREGLEILLRRRGHRVLAASGGQEGLDLLAEEGADLVITDLKMSKVDGLEVLRQTKETAPDTEVLVTDPPAGEVVEVGTCVRIVTREADSDSS